MYSLEALISTAIITLVLGTVLGLIISQRKGPSIKAQRDMEKHLSEMQKQQQNYQQEVTEHFTQTAALLDQLSESYRDVHNHLAKGAHKLAGEAASSKLSMLPDQSGEISDEELSHITPPLDYAPKTPFSKGVLTEDFDIDNTDDNIENSGHKTGRSA